MFSILNYILADTGFFINLDKSTERLNNVNKQIEHFNIRSLNRFPALTNEEIPQSSATDSHLKIFDWCSNNNIGTVAVFEDDFQFYMNLNILRNYNVLLEDYLSIIVNELQNTEWDVFFLGFNPKKTCIPINKYLCKVFKSTGAWGYLIKKPAYQFLLNTTNYSRDRLAIDDLLPMLTYNGFRCYASNISMCNHGTNFISTLQPSLGYIDYSEWILGNYHQHIWNSMEQNLDFNNFDDVLTKLYNDTSIARESIIEINNFDGDINKLENFNITHTMYKNCFINISPCHFPGLSYYTNTEAKNLFHCKENKYNILDLPINTINIQL